jgi:hypothetical protein
MRAARRPVAIIPARQDQIASDCSIIPRPVPARMSHATGISVILHDHARASSRIAQSSSPAPSATNSSLLHHAARWVICAAGYDQVRRLDAFVAAKHYSAE